MSKKKGIPVMIRLNEDEITEIDMIAKKECRSRNMTITMAVRELLEKRRETNNG